MKNRNYLQQLLYQKAKNYFYKYEGKYNQEERSQRSGIELLINILEALK